MGIHQQPKEFRDAYPAEAWKAVKLAIRQTIAKAGGVEAVAAIFSSTKLNPGRVSEWQSLNPEHLNAMPNVWQVAQIEASAGVDWITEAMAAMHDADVVKRVRSPDPTAVLISRLAVAAREFGEACAASAEYVANPDCRKRHEAAVREFQEAMRALMGMGAALENTGEAA